MIKANDLRVTNFVSYRNEIVLAVLLIGIDSVSLIKPNGQTIVAKLDEIFPIPLTDYWLQRFSFSDKAYKDGFIGIDVNHTNFVLTKPGGEYDFKYYSWQFKNDIWPKYNELKYVHQLQNFFYALTEEELVIKPVEYKIDSKPDVIE